MPLVCLANTFARWQSLKTSETAISKPVLAQSAESPANTTKKSFFAGPKTLHIPHSPKAVGGMPEIKVRPSVRMTREDLINAESKLGSTIFGPIPAGHRREFFHDKQNVWIWHEDWYDGQRNPHQMTVRYEVRTSGVYKKVSTGSYFKLEGEELENFRKATHAYLYVIKKHLYTQNKNTATQAA